MTRFCFWHRDAQVPNYRVQLTAALAPAVSNGHRTTFSEVEHSSALRGVTYGPGRYGSPCLYQLLRQAGWTVSRRRSARLMRAAGWRAKAVRG